MDHFGLYPALLSLKDVERDVRFLADPGQTVVMPLLTNPAIRRGSIARTDQPSFNAGDGLQLRPWRQEDATAVAEVYQDLQIRRWRCRTIDDLAEAKSLIESWRRGWHDETGAAWAVVDDGDHLVGRMALTALDLHEGTGDVAYWTRIEARGRGVAPRAVRRVADWASQAGFHRLQLKHSTRNLTSCRVAVKTGFQPEGTLSSAVMHEDGWHDMHVHALILTN
jgi:RimJ/RimL family protein N-acetyltransferase